MYMCAGTYAKEIIYSSLTESSLSTLLAVLESREEENGAGCSENGEVDAGWTRVFLASALGVTISRFLGTSRRGSLEIGVSFDSLD